MVKIANLFYFSFTLTFFGCACISSPMHRGSSNSIVLQYFCIVTSESIAISIEKSQSIAILIAKLSSIAKTIAKYESIIKRIAHFFKYCKKYCKILMYCKKYCKIQKYCKISRSRKKFQLWYSLRNFD